MPHDILSMTGRCADGPNRDSGRLYHAVPPHDHRALCGAKPGKRSGWSSHAGQVVTCPRCLKRIAAIAPTEPSSPDKGE